MLNDYCKRAWIASVFVSLSFSLSDLTFSAPLCFGTCVVSRFPDSYLLITTSMNHTWSLVIVVRNVTV